MSCEDVRRRLDELVDGAVSAADRADLDRHVAGCPDCARELEELRRLRDRIAELPRQIAPQRDLWPDISGRLEPSGDVVAGGFGSARWRWLAAAAAVVAAVGSLLIAYSIGRSQGGAGTVVVRAATPLAVPAGLADTGFAEVEQEFRAAREQLMAALESRRGDLSPETLRTLEDNLGVIDGAIERIASALAQDPLNPRLAGQLTSAYRRQIELLQRASRLPAEI